MTTTTKYAPTMTAGKATPDAMESILRNRSVQITDKGQLWTAPLPMIFPLATDALDTPMDAITGLVNEFGASEILSKILAQMLIDFRAACRANVGRDFSPQSWKPNMQPLKKADQTDKLMAQMQKIATAAGITVDDLLAQMKAK